MERRDFEAQRLVEEHPPILRSPNKKVVHGIACPPGSVHRGNVVYSRWEAMPLPESFAPDRAVDDVVRHEGFYDYRPVLSAPGAVEWHVNFADPHLFFAYGGPLFAQDEIQVAEHPILGSQGSAAGLLRHRPHRRAGPADTGPGGGSRAPLSRRHGSQPGGGAPEGPLRERIRQGSG